MDANLSSAETQSDINKSIKDLAHILKNTKQTMHQDQYNSIINDFEKNP